MAEHRAYIPPARAPVEAGLGPLVFLAGPIQGAPDWQAEATRLLLPHADVANPRRADWAAGCFDAQVAWETAHLRLAATTGVVLFWLAREAEPVSGRCYAQTTRFELGEWLTERRFAHLALGIEPGFAGERYIRARLAQSAHPLPVQATLEATCDEAVRLLRGPPPRVRF